MDERTNVLFMSLNNELTNKFTKYLLMGIKLSNYSWFNLGGPAEYFFKPKDKHQLIEFLNDNKKNPLEITILGAGSNTLIRDNGIKGVVIKLGSNFSAIKMIDENLIEAGSSALDRKVASFAKEHSIGGLEFLSCIPGTIGGAVIMNSGCYGHDISKILNSINVIDKTTGEEKEITSDKIKFFYRRTNLSERFIIISAKLKGKRVEKKVIEEKQNNMLDRKKLSQPNQIKTCGSTFKNVNNEKKAWQLIKETGCENFKEGDATISAKHCNFFVNNGRAKSSDIEKLINRVKNQVADKTGVNLELEIKIIGD